MAVEWSPDLTVNHELLDGQHVELFRTLADAGAALDGPPQALEAALDRFVDLLLTHFAVEERLMDESLYPERVRHRSAHEMFLADFERLRAALRAAEARPEAADGIRRRVPEWLHFHVRMNDVPFGAYLARRQQLQPDQRRDGGRRLS